MTSLMTNEKYDLTWRHHVDNLAIQVKQQVQVAHEHMEALFTLDAA
jgi:hypothetical protein